MGIRSLVRSTTIFGLGAASAYLFDPDRGRARRARLKDQSAARVRRLVREQRASMHYMRNKKVGERYAREHPTSPPEDDAVLVQKVRSEVLGQPPFHQLHLVVDAFGGVVHLRGAVGDPVLANQVEHAVSEVEGVVRVESYLHRPGEPAPNKVPGMAPGHIVSDRLTMAGPEAFVSDETRRSEASDAMARHDADRPPTPREEADAPDYVDPEVAENYERMARMGGATNGEGRVP